PWSKHPHQSRKVGSFHYNESSQCRGRAEPLEHFQWTRAPIRKTYLWRNKRKSADVLLYLIVRAGRVGSARSFDRPSVKPADLSALGKSEQKRWLGGCDQSAHFRQSRTEHTGHFRAGHVAAGKQKHAAACLPEHCLLVCVPTDGAVFGQHDPATPAGFREPL